MTLFYLPDLGEGLAEAEIREWYVKEGDTVEVDQPLLSVETAKAVVDVPSPIAGRITQLHGKAQDVIKTHALLVEFEGAAPKKAGGSIVGRLEESLHALQEEVIIGAATKTVKVPPLVKALAQQLKVDLHTVIPTGPKGQMTVEDVKRQNKTNQSPDKQTETLHGVRRAMAMAMRHAHQEVAQITLMDDVDIGHLAKDADLTVLLLQAMAAGVKAEPALNAWFDGKTLERELFTETNIGLAIDTPQGLFVPVLKAVECSSREECRKIINQFKESVTARTITPGDMQGATITLSNFGTIAGKYASPIVMPPTVAILGCGRIHDAVVVRDGKTHISRLMPLSLSADHRAVTGGEAARFLAAVVQFLEKAT